MNTSTANTNGTNNMKKVLFFALVTLTYGSLFCVYFLIDFDCSWIQQIDWLNNIKNAKIVLFILELLSITMVIITSLTIITKSSRRDKFLDLNIKEKCFFSIILILVIVYACVRIANGDKIIPRLIYTFYSFLYLCFWVKNAYMLLIQSCKKWLQIISDLDQHPNNVFYLGRELSYAINSISISLIILMIPISCWLPTLLPGSVINPKIITYVIGLLIILSFLGLSIQSQKEISEALNSSFLKFDQYVSTEVEKIKDFNKEESERLKNLMELRENLVKSINLSAQEFLPVIISSGTIIGFLSAAIRL